VNTYNPTLLWQQPVPFENLGVGMHTVVLRNAGSAYVDLDAVQVFATATVPTP
jgi:hypothetical protein